MNYGFKEKEWISTMYIKGLHWNDIHSLHNNKVKFPIRTKAALQKFVSRYVNGKI